MSTFLWFLVGDEFLHDVADPGFVGKVDYEQVIFGLHGSHSGLLPHAQVEYPVNQHPGGGGKGHQTDQDDKNHGSDAGAERRR